MRELTNEEKIAFAEFQALSAAQKNACSAHDILYASFPHDENFRKVYPSYYGGDYIEDNILHICIVDLPNQDVTPYMDLLADYRDDITFDNVTYSLDTLYEAAGVAAEGLINDGISVTSWGISESDNAVMISVPQRELSVLGLHSIKIGEDTFYTQNKNEYDVPVLFTVEDSVSADATALIGGDAVANASGNTYTLGICGTYGGQAAFAMCGHGWTVGDPVYYETSKGTKLGTIKVAHYENQSEGDYSVTILTAKDYTTTNLINDQLDQEGDCPVSGTCSRPSKGTYVLKSGAEHDFSYGKVVETSVMVTDTRNNVKIFGLVKVELSWGEVGHGDSGAPVYIAKDTSAIFCGVHSMSVKNAGESSGTTISYFSPYEYLETAGFKVKTTS